MKKYDNSNEYPNTKQGLFPLAPITIVTGHYGVGKTNFSLNLAHDVKKVGKQVTLIDLDIVNPYFRSSDYAALLESSGIRVISPVFAGSTLDVPSLSGAIYPALELADEENIVIVDVGGDEVGAGTLGRFSTTITTKPYRLMYVINAYRNLTQTPEEAAELFAEIEAKSGLKASGVVNNSHLGYETDLSVIEKSLEYAERVASLLDQPLLASTIPVTAKNLDNAAIANDIDYNSMIEGSAPKSSMLLSTRRMQDPYFVQVYVRTPWEL